MPRPHKAAAPLLAKLCDLAAFQNRLPEFQARIAALQAQYASLPAFQERLHKAGLFQECVFLQMRVSLRVRIGVIRSQAFMGCRSDEPVIGREE